MILTALICRLLIQDGTGEAHLYLRDRVIPIALGVTDTEWSDLLDLVYKGGQLSYNKSSFSKVYYVYDLSSWRICYLHKLLFFS